MKNWRICYEPVRPMSGLHEDLLRGWVPQAQMGVPMTQTPLEALDELVRAAQAGGMDSHKAYELRAQALTGAGEPVGWDKRYPTVYVSKDGSDKIAVKEWEPGGVITFMWLIDRDKGHWVEAEYTPEEARQLAIGILNKPCVITSPQTPTPDPDTVTVRREDFWEWRLIKDYPLPRGVPYVVGAWVGNPVYDRKWNVIAWLDEPRWVMEVFSSFENEHDSSVIYADGSKYKATHWISGTYPQNHLPVILQALQVKP